MKGIKTRFFALFLVATVLITANDFTVLAQTVSENQAEVEEKTIEEAMPENDGASMSENTMEENQQKPDEQQEAATVSDNMLHSGEGSPDNPVYTEKEKTNFNYVYFGSYPQTEVTGKALTSQIINAPYDKNGDAWVNGVKYRRLYKYDDIPSRANFGDKIYRYYKWERIKWKVLQNNGSTLFIVADKAIDCESSIRVTDSRWELHPVRTWLNNTFYNQAFSKEEQQGILEKNVKTEDYIQDNSVYVAGNDTRDKLFLLAAEELKNESYGFCEDSFTPRRVKPSDYAIGRGTWICRLREYAGNCRWMMRSPGGNRLSFVSYSGYIDMIAYVSNAPGSEEETVNDHIFGVVPAMYLSLSSPYWDSIDDKSSGDGGVSRTLTGLKASKAKTVYQTGEALNLNDLKVTASYQIHADRVLASDNYTTNAASIDMNTPGNKTLVITHSNLGVTKTAAIPIQVKEIKVSQLTITGPSKKLAAGKKVSLTCKASPENAVNKSVTWKSSNSKYAAVNQKGKVTLKKAGAGKSVTITATAKDGSNVKASYKIKIMKHAVKSIKLKAPAKKLKTGKSMTIKATIKTTGSQANKALKWSSSNTGYATVSSKGKVTAKKAGKGKTVTITASALDGSNKKAKVKIKIY